MKVTGIIRCIDELGRIVIPIEIRERFNIKEKDQIEIYVDSGKIILKKYIESCYICGLDKNLIEFKKKKLCKKCINELVNVSKEGLKVNNINRKKQRVRNNKKNN